MVHPLVLIRYIPSAVRVGLGVGSLTLLSVAALTKKDDFAYDACDSELFRKNHLKKKKGFYTTKVMN